MKSDKRYDKRLVTGFVVGLLVVGIVLTLIFGVRIELGQKVDLVGPDEPVYYMLHRGAPLDEIKLELENNPGLVKEFTWAGGTLLHLAAEKGREDVVELLLDMGANPTGDGPSPLMSAIAGGNAEVVKKLLVNEGVSPMAPEPPFGLTPYEMGMRSGDEAIIRLLREAKLRHANSGVADDRGESK